MNNTRNLTIVIVTYKTDKKVLLECINSIDSQVKILIIENSNNIILKEELENLYSNLTVILSGKNLGYGALDKAGRIKEKAELLADDAAKKVGETTDDITSETEDRFDIIQSECLGKYCR